MSKPDGTKTAKFYAPANGEIKGSTITTEVDGKNTPHRIKISGQEGEYALYDIASDLYLVNRTKKNVLDGVKEESATWNITFTAEGNADIKSTLSEYRSIFYNPQMARFATYTTTTQKPVQLYKFEKVVTGISYVNATTSQSKDGIYTLHGQKVSNNTNTANLQKGVYIVNGKKVLVK